MCIHGNLLLYYILCSPLLDFLFLCACYSRCTKYSSPFLRCFSLSCCWLHQDHYKICSAWVTQAKASRRRSMPSFWIFILLILCWSWNFFVLPGLCWFQPLFSVGCLWTLGSLQYSWHEPSPLPGSGEIPTCGGVCICMCMSISTLRMLFLFIASFILLLICLLSFLLLVFGLSESLGLTPCGLSKTILKALPPSDFLQFWYWPNCNRFSSVVLHGWVRLCMSCSTISGLVKGRIAFYFFLLMIICIFSSIWWEFHWRKTTLEYVPELKELVEIGLRGSTCSFSIAPGRVYPKGGLKESFDKWRRVVKQGYRHILLVVLSGVIKLAVANPFSEPGRNSLTLLSWNHFGRWQASLLLMAPIFNTMGTRVYKSQCKNCYFASCKKGLYWSKNENKGDR